MRGEDSRLHFRARITRQGTIILPADAGHGFSAGQTVNVSVARAARKGSVVPVDDREVSEIAALQAEPAGVIRRCLAAQGALASKARAAAGKRPGRTGKR